MRNRIVTLATLALFLAALAPLAADKPSEKKQTEAQTQAAESIEDLLNKKEYQKAVDLSLKFIESWTAAGKEADLPAAFYENMGLAYFNLKDFPKAIEAYDKAFDRSGQLDPKPILYKAACYYEAGDKAKVIATYRQIIAMDATLFEGDSQLDAKFSLAHLLEEQSKLSDAQKADPQKKEEADKKFLEAVALYDELVKSDPTFKDIALDAGKMMLEKGDFAKARFYFEALKVVSPNNEEMLLALAQTILKQQKYAEAIPALEEYLKVATKDLYKFVMMKNLALCQLKEKRYEDSLATYAKILAQRPEDETALLNRAQIYVDQKKYAEAITALEAAQPLIKSDTKKKEVANLLKQLKAQKKK